MRPAVTFVHLVAFAHLGILQPIARNVDARYITRIHSNYVSPWAEKHSESYQEMCVVASRGPCQKGQHFGPVPKFALLLPSCENYGVNCGKESGSANCISIAGNDTLRTLMDETSEQGICIWSKQSNHSCTGYPANYRLYPKDGRCYPVQDYDVVELSFCMNGRNYFRQLSSRDNPCTGSKIFQEVDQLIGDCDCGRTDDIYWAPTDECYQSNTKGPCPGGQWIVLDAHGKPHCQNTTCSTDGKHVELRNPITGSVSCYMTDYTGIPSIQGRPNHTTLPDGSPCEAGFLFRTSIYPEELVCVGGVVCGAGLLLPPVRICPAGSKRSLAGRCEVV